MDKIVNPLDILDFAYSGSTYQSRLQRNPYRMAAFESYLRYRFNRKFEDFLYGYLFDFSYYRYKEGKGTNKDHIIQEAMRAGEIILSFGNIIDEDYWFELLYWEFYDNNLFKKKIKIDLPEDFEQICMESLIKNEKAAFEYKNGKLTAINPLKGYVIKHFKGKVDNKIIEEKIKSLLK